MKNELLGCLRLLFVTLGCLVAAVLLLVLVLVLKHNYDYHFGFDQQKWVATGELLRSDKEDKGLLRASNPRESMAADVMAHHLQLGMTRAQVLALLGPPDRDGIEMVVPDSVRLPDSLNGEKGVMNTAGFNEWHRLNAKPDTLIRYWVGWDIIDPTSMRVQFGGDGKVKKYWVRIH
jgi:hypothetical protein